MPRYEHSRTHEFVLMGHEKRPSITAQEPAINPLPSSRSTLAHQVGYAFWDRSTRNIIEFDCGFARVVPWLPAMLTCRFGEGNSLLSDDARLQPRDMSLTTFFFIKGWSDLPNVPGIGADFLLEDLQNVALSSDIVAAGIEPYRAQLLRTTDMSAPLVLLIEILAVAENVLWIASMKPSLLHVLAPSVPLTLPRPPPTILASATLANNNAHPSFVPAPPPPQKQLVRVFKKPRKLRPWSVAQFMLLNPQTEKAETLSPSPTKRKR